MLFSLLPGYKLIYFVLNHAQNIYKYLYITVCTELTTYYNITQTINTKKYLKSINTKQFLLTILHRCKPNTKSIRATLVASSYSTEFSTFWLYILPIIVIFYLFNKQSIL